MENIKRSIIGKTGTTRSNPPKKNNLRTELGLACIGAFFILSYTEFGKNDSWYISPFVILLIGIALYAYGKYAINGIKEPVLIQLHTDYIVVYRECFHYDKTNPRMQLERFRYGDITKVTWSKAHKELIICGVAEVEATDYDQKGELILDSERTSIETTKCVIGTEYMTDIDFKKEIEEHTPLTVEVIEPIHREKRRIRAK